MRYEDSFRRWLAKNPDHKYSEKTIQSYIRALNKAGEWFEVTLECPIFEIGDVAELAREMERIKSSLDYDRLNYEHGHNTFSAAASAYE